MGGLLGRAKAAAKGAADEAQDLVDDAPQVGTLPLLRQPGSFQPADR